MSGHSGSEIVCAECSAACGKFRAVKSGEQRDKMQRNADARRLQFPRERVAVAVQFFGDDADKIQMPGVSFAVRRQAQEIAPAERRVVRAHDGFSPREKIARAFQLFAAERT